MNAVCPFDGSEPTDVSEVEPFETAPFPNTTLISVQLAESFIRDHHYLGTLPSSVRLNYGATEGPFLMAVACYGPCHNPRSPKDWLELRRLAVHPSAHRFTLSRFLAQTLRILRRRGVPAVLTWADPNMGHHGGIYQATNWIFTQPPSWNWNSWFKTPEGKVLNHRDAFKLCGTSSKAGVLAQHPDWTAFRPLPKYRYLKCLNIRKAKALSLLNCEESPYPKPLHGVTQRTKELPRKKKGSTPSGGAGDV